MRKFFIMNKFGARKPLNNEEGIFFSKPAGLGQNLTPTFANMRQGFFRPISGDAEPQNSITGDLVFTSPDAYEDYRDFINWCAGAKELYLVYRPFGTAEFFRTVQINYMTKTELGSAKWLTVPVSFACLTPWYRAAPSYMTMSEETGEITRYSFSYTPSLRYSSSNQGSMAVDIGAEGHIPAALEVTYTGAIINPVLTLKCSSTSTIVGACKLNTTLTAGERLEVSTKYGDSFVRKISSTGVVTDLLQCLDLSTDPFPRVPIDEDCTLYLSADDTIRGSATVQVYYYYRSV